MSKAHKKKIVIIAAVAATVIIAAGAMTAGVAASSGGWSLRETDTIAHGVRIGDVAVGELTPAQANERLRAWAHEQLAAPVTLTAPVTGRRWNLTVYEAGGRYDIDGAIKKAYQIGRDGNWLERLMARSRAAARSHVQIEPEFLFSESKLKKRLAAIGETIRVRPRSARAQMEGNVLVVTRPERKGIRLDVDATAEALLKDGEDALKDGSKAKLVINEEKPAVTADELGEVSHMLASYATYYGSSSSNRRHNVELAARNINGTLLGPGETFSYNDVVGPRTRRLGWRSAPEYRDGEVVQGIGGGVCQVSTTLYNALLFANLKVVRRQNHSMPVTYVRAGRDAVVSYGSLDLQFENNTGGPIYIAARGRGGRLSMSIFGTPPAEKQEVRVVSGSRRGTRSGGFTVSTWRVVTGEDGESKREFLHTDYYRPHTPAPSPTRVARR